MGLILYSNTPRSLNYRRSGVTDWTRKEHTQGPPQTQLATSDVETEAKLGEGGGREAFDEDVGELRGGWYMKNPHLIDGNPIPDKV
jgi:hypothetical protein